MIPGFFLLYIKRFRKKNEQNVYKDLYNVTL